MEYNLSKHSVGIMNRFLDTVNEQIVDVDVSLPDYCPDIEKILKCTLIPKVYTKKISGGQLTVDGVSCVRILYCDSVRHNIRAYEQTVPFTANFNLKSTPEQYVILVDTKCEYINCRALSPRKLVVHGAFSLYAKVLSKDQNEVYCYDEESDLQVKLSDICASDLCAICQEQFSVTEDISVSSQPPVESLLSYDVSATITELKTVHNKIMLNAELSLRALYISDLDSGKVERLSYVFPVNRIIDCDGVSDETVNIPYLEVMYSDLHVRNDNLNDGSTLTLDVKLSFSELGYCEKQISIIEDAYSTKYATEHKRSSLNIESKHSCENLTHIIKSTVKLDSVKISEVLDIYSEAVTLTPVISDNSMNLSGKTNVCILLEDEDSKPFYIERSIDIDYQPEFEKAFDRVELKDCKIHSISYRIVDESTLELRVELKVTLVLCDVVSQNPVTAIECNEDAKVSCDDCSLILYYADKGESLWNIAKMYNTKESLLKEENVIDTEVVEKSTMLLVPTE